MTAEDLLAKYDVRVAGLALSLRGFLFRELKGITEIPDPGANMIAYVLKEALAAYKKTKT